MEYAELHCRTNFSFLQGASHPQELVSHAILLQLRGLAITDLSGLYAVVRAWEARNRLRRSDDPVVAAGAAALCLIYGSELELDLPLANTRGQRAKRGRGHEGAEDVASANDRANACADALVVLAADRYGYGVLSEWITIGRRRAPKGAFSLSGRELRTRGGKGLIVLCGGPRSRLLRLVRAGELVAAACELAALREAFGDALYLEVFRHHRPGDAERSLALARLAGQLAVPVVATNDVFFHEAHRKKLHDVLRCIQRGICIAEAGRELLPNAERHLKGEAQMARLFADLPGAVARSVEVSDRCQFDLDQLSYSYPQQELPHGESADDMLARLARQGLVERLGPLRARELRGRLQHELSLIAELAYAGYFLTMWEVVRFCRRERILCQGRGSAANSLVCFAVGITSVSPDQIEMLFERFISRERREPPDIDLDIEHERREEVIQYVYERYDRDHAAMVCEFISYRHRSALRDVGKVLGFSEQTLARVSRYLASGWGGYSEPPEDHSELAPLGLAPESAGQPSAAENEEAERGYDLLARRSVVKEQAARAAGIDPHSRSWKQLLLLCELLVNFPRHLSIHVGGFLLCAEPIATLVPIENARMPGRTVIQWDKDDVEALGLFKVDLLGLGMLNVIARAFALVQQSRGLELELNSVPQGDRATYQMIQRADTIGVFQIESRAQMNMLPRLKPETFYDLVIEVALVRPGPIQGGMVHPYLRRRRAEEPVVYPHPALESILCRTLGVPIFQEQVMRIAVAVGGYSPGEADQLRRDMAAWRRCGNMGSHQARLFQAMRERGISEDFATRIIGQVEGFGSYGFPESHAAAFAQLVYISAYLKCHFAPEFAAALINAQPMGFYQVSSIVADVHRHGVPILPIDVQESAVDVTVVRVPGAKVPGAADAEVMARGLRLGLRLVRGLSSEAAEGIVAARQLGGPFHSLSDLSRRADLSRKALTQLASAGALGGLVADRREALWQASALGRGGGLFAHLAPEEPAVRFRPLAPQEGLRLDYIYGQSFVEQHPLALYRERLRGQGVVRACDLRQVGTGSRVTVVGLVIVRQRPGGGRMIFMALEDETGLVDVASPVPLFEEHRQLIMLAEMLWVEGVLQRDGDARSVMAKRFRAVRGAVGAVHSRDFH